MTLFVVVVVLVVSPSSLAFVAAVVLTGNAQHRDRDNFIFNDTKFFICVRPKGFIFIIFIIYLIIVVARFIISHKEKKRKKTGLLLLLHNLKKIHSFIDLTPY